jgi:hypothetical protein
MGAPGLDVRLLFQRVHAEAQRPRQQSPSAKLRREAFNVRLALSEVKDLCSSYTDGFCANSRRKWVQSESAMTSAH